MAWGVIVDSELVKGAKGIEIGGGSRRGRISRDFFDFRGRVGEKHKFLVDS